jgi:sulfatase maturation enzyme AslB (radical SAM superfamily)
LTRIHPDLPVFLLTRGTSNVLYAPGHLAVVTAAEAEKARAGRIAAPLRECAGRAVETWRRRLEAPFEPECLTVYFGGACDLACPYCFASAASQPAPFNEAAVLAAARLVARFSAAKRKPFHLTLHGGGEPALHWDALVRLVEATQRIARQAETGWFGYIATNGVMNGERVRWLARNVDLTGISCDGPPDIQDRQRPLAGGGASSIFVERTAGILAQMGARFAVRATITPPAVERQAEIVAYLNERLGATELRFEPVYRVEPGFAPGQAEWFLDHFLAAQREARKRGCDLQLSGTRLDEVHGPYCNVLRDVLQVAADGTAAGCFLESGAGTGIGGWDETGGEYRIDAEKIAAQRRKLAEIPARCRDCFNLYHCARDCPERCALTGAEAAPGFRCRLERLLGEAWIFEAAGRRDPLGPLLENAPPSVDRTAIREQWRAATRSYAIERRRMPLPVWARRGFEHDGAEARRHLQDVLSAAPAAPMSVYLHVPFCDRRCGFCDCYSVPLGPRSREKEVRFEQALAAEIDAWASIEALAKRRVTTVHFGGGTPNCWARPSLNASWQECGSGSEFRPAPNGPSSRAPACSPASIWTGCGDGASGGCTWGFRRSRTRRGS